MKKRSSPRRLTAAQHGSDVGLCQCGCGQETFVPPYNNRSKGWVKGQPIRFVNGHGAYLTTPAWVEEDRGYSTPCWIWQRAMQPNGYGAMTINRRTHNAHRGVWLRDRGPIPEGMVLDHLCRVRACVNPDHMEIVTNAENLRRGNGAKLTPENVAYIRSSDEPGKALAERFGVSVWTISAVRTRRKWR